MTRVRIHPPQEGLEGTVRVPYSKPHMQRAILFSLLANAPSVVINPAWSSEAADLFKAAQEFGLGIVQRDESTLVLSGVGKSLARSRTDSALPMAGSAFNFRTVAALSSIWRGETVLEANASMLNRPVLEHLRFIRDLGAGIEDISDTTRLRVRVKGTGDLGGETWVDTRHSSQVLTAVLLISPLAERPVHIRCSSALPVGTGYVDLTVGMMREHGVQIDHGDATFVVYPGAYQSRLYRMTSDFTALSYPACAVATARGGPVLIADYHPSSLSSETDFLAVLSRLGIKTVHDQVERTLRIERVAPQGPHIEIDGRNIPTVVTTLAAVAPFIDAKVTLRNAAHVNNHKSRRVEGIVSQLARMGCAISPAYDREGRVDGFTTPGPSTPDGDTAVSSHGDHRLFMSLATAALGARRPVVVDGAQHLHASYPGYLRSLADLGVRWDSLSPGLAPAARSGSPT